MTVKDLIKILRGHPETGKISLVVADGWIKLRTDRQTVIQTVIQATSYVYNSTGEKDTHSFPASGLLIPKTCVSEPPKPSKPEPDYPNLHPQKTQKELYPNLDLGD